MTKKIKQIFSDHFDEFLRLYESKTRQVVIEDVRRMLECGDLSKGYKEYSCNNCDEVKKVAFRCKSRFCTTCGKKYVDERSENMSAKLIKITHRHMVFTIPEELRVYFRHDRKRLNLLPQKAYEVLKAFFHKRSKKECFIPGVVAIIHTFGRDLKWNPHVHLLVTEGGMGKITDWKKIVYFSYERLRKSWQKLILDGSRKSIKKEKRKFSNLVSKLYAFYPDGFYVYGDSKVKNEKSATSYVGRYTGRPAIADSRIISYDGENVTFYYDEHKTKERVEETLSAIDFIKKVIIHIADRQFKMIRYYGIYANKRTKHCKVVKMLHEKVKEIRKKYKSWRKKIRLSFGHDPLLCPKCNREMILSDVVYPGIGSILDVIHKREYDKMEQELFEIQEQHDIIRRKIGYEPFYV